MFIVLNLYAALIAIQVWHRLATGCRIIKVYVNTRYCTERCCRGRGRNLCSQIYLEIPYSYTHKCCVKKSHISSFPGQKWEQGKLCWPSMCWSSFPCSAYQDHLEGANDMQLMVSVPYSETCPPPLHGTWPTSEVDQGWFLRKSTTFFTANLNVGRALQAKTNTCWQFSTKWARGRMLRRCAAPKERGSTGRAGQGSVLIWGTDHI